MPTKFSKPNCQPFVFIPSPSLLSLSLVVVVAVGWVQLLELVHFKTRFTVPLVTFAFILIHGICLVSIYLNWCFIEHHTLFGFRPVQICQTESRVQTIMWHCKEDFLFYFYFLCSTTEGGGKQTKIFKIFKPLGKKKPSEWKKSMSDKSKNLFGTPLRMLRDSWRRDVEFTPLSVLFIEHVPCTASDFSCWLTAFFSAVCILFFFKTTQGRLRCVVWKAFILINQRGFF